jgi:hypothetical protein
MIPALEWLKSNNWLSVFGTGLLNGLKEKQEQGKSPNAQP